LNKFEQIIEEISNYWCMPFSSFVGFQFDKQVLIVFETVISGRFLYCVTSTIA